MLTGRDAELAERLREAAASGRTQLVIQLLESGAPFIVDSDGQTALHLAASAGHAETVSALILGGCDIGIQDFSGHTPLQKAAAEGHLDIVKQLLKQGASVDHQDEVHGNTSLHEAAWKGFSQTVSVLCKSKANFYIKNRGGFAPLHLCCQNGHNETCRVLLLNGCKPDLKNNYGDTPLHTSARYGHAGVIRILVSGRCNVSEQNKNGDTALHIAAAMGRRKLTKILLESGCDKDAKNKQNETAMDISRRKELAEIVSILQNPPPILSEKDREDQAMAARDRSQSHPRPSKSDKKREKTSTSSKENDHERGSKREKKRSRHSKERPEAKLGPEDPNAWASPYGCHNEPDMEEFPLPRMNTLPDDPLRAGEQYFFDLAGNIKKGPVTKPVDCHCGPSFQKFEKKLERDKKELLKHIDNSHTKLNTKISHLERKTRDQLFNLNQSMKESFALERSECLDRMDRRALRERIAIERQQAVRDVGLKRDLASWLDKKLQEIEVKHGADAKNAALLRSLAVRASKRGKKYVLSDIEGGGTLRRSMSEELLSDVGLPEDSEAKDMRSSAANIGDSTNVYKGLKVSDTPSANGGRLVSSGRVRRNSAGDSESAGHYPGPVTHSVTDSDRELRDSVRMAHSTASESFHDTSVTSVSTCDRPGSGAERRTDAPGASESLSRMSGGRQAGLIRPIPMCYSSENLPGETSKPGGGQYQPPDSQAYPPPFPSSQIQPIRRFTTEADIHHATPLMLDTAPSLAAPPYRAPPRPAPAHLYHPRDRLARPGPLLPPVDEDEYVALEDKEQDLHRQLLNLPVLQSDGGSHDSHNDSGYSTRLGASAGPSPSLSGSRPGSTDGDGYHQAHGGHGGGHQAPEGHPAYQGPSVGPKIRALQHQLKLTDISEAKGSLV